MLQPRLKSKKVPATGYENESVSLHKTINATDFIQSSDYLELLASAYKVSQFSKVMLAVESVVHLSNPSYRNSLVFSAVNK